MSLPTLERWPLVGRRLHLESFLDALQDPSIPACAIAGLSGVGKTRLLDECRVAAEIEGHTTLRIVGSRAAATVPLGAMAALVPGPASRGTTGLADAQEHVLDALRSVAPAPPAPAPSSSGRRAVRPEGLVLVVDDAHLLDDHSVAVLERVVREQLAFVVASVRSDDPAAAPLPWLTATGVTIQLDDLTRMDVDTLLHLALGAPLEGRTGAQVWDITKGNALYVRELTLGAVDAGTLVDDGGVWHLTAPLTTTGRLRDLVEDRIRASSPEGREVLEILALGEPVGRADLEQVVAPESIDALHASGLIHIEVDGRRTQVTIAHLLHAEVVRESLPVVRRRNLLRAHAERVIAHGARRADDAVRIAVWRLDSDGRADAAVLVAAARVARAAHRYDEVQRLARAAALDDPTLVDAAVLLGEAHHELGAFADADEALGAAQRLATTEQEHLVAAVLRARTLATGLHDVPGALAVLDAAAGVVTDPVARAELVTAQARVLVEAGQPMRAAELFDAVAPAASPPGAQDDRAVPRAADDVSRRLLVLRALALAPVLALAGRTAEALALAESGYEEHMALGDVFAVARPRAHVHAQVVALVQSGRLDEAQQLADAGHALGVNEGLPTEQAEFAMQLGGIALLRGRPTTALGWFREARACARSRGLQSCAHRAASACAIAEAQLADAAAARATLAGPAGSDGPAADGPAADDPAGAHGTAWVLAAEGHLDDAAALLVTAGASALEAGDLATASALWHDAVRLDPASDVAPSLDALAARTDAALFRARANHADAVRRADREALAASVDELAQLGLDLVAAEAAFAASDAFRLAGEQRTAATSSHRGEQLLAQCEGARTPRSVQVEVIVPLSKRERDVALLAAQGVQSKDIAQRLGLSVRTVNNHLQRAYTKLGVSNREELAQALGPDRPTTDERGAGA